MLNLKNIVLSGVKWSGLAQVSIQILGLVRWFVLASLISPEYFGIVALGLMVVTLPRILIEESTSSALIRYENPDDKLLSSCFWFNIGIAVLISFIFTPIAYIVSLYFGEFLIFYIFLTYAFFSVLGSITQIQFVLLKKQLKFQFLAGVEILSFFASTCVAVYLAVNDYYWQAIVSQATTGYVISSLCYYFKTKLKILFFFSTDEINKVFSFSLYVTGYRLMTYLMTFLDDFLIGRYFGENALGIYDRSYQLAHLPMRKITNKISAVLYPAYSAKQTHTKQINEMHLSIIRISILLYLPILAGFVVFSKPLITLFLSETWEGVGELLPIIAAGAIFRALANHNVSLFLVYNRPDLLLRFGFFSRLSGIIGILAGFSWGIEGICTGYTVGCFVGLQIEWRGIRQFGLNSIEAFKGCGSSFVLITVISLFMFLPIFTITSDKFHFLLHVIIFGVLIVFGYYYLHKNLIQQILKEKID